ncbi:MAG: hypothetical protein ABIU05_20495 [Nitrospirales bacterium]
MWSSLDFHYDDVHFRIAVAFRVCLEELTVGGRTATQNGETDDPPPSKASLHIG